MSTEESSGDIHLTAKELCTPGGQTTVFLIGSGGTGSHVLEGLAMINAALVQVGHGGLHVEVCDPDTVETHNVGRQLFGWSDVGKSKCQALLSRINRMYGTRWAETEPFTKEKWPKGNLVITTVDNGWVRNLVHERFRFNGGFQPYEMHGGSTRTRYWLDIGNGRMFGQYVLGSHDLSTSVDLFGRFSEEQEEEDNSCSAADSLSRQDLFINKALATHACHLLWSMITCKYTRTCGGFIDLEQGVMKPLTVRASVDALEQIKQKQGNKEKNAKNKDKALVHAGA